VRALTLAASALAVTALTTGCGGEEGDGGGSEGGGGMAEAMVMASAEAVKRVVAVRYLRRWVAS
jgi:hypothetical protein